MPESYHLITLPPMNITQSYCMRYIKRGSYKLQEIKMGVRPRLELIILLLLIA